MKNLFGKTLLSVVDEDTFNFDGLFCIGMPYLLNVFKWNFE